MDFLTPAIEIIKPLIDLLRRQINYVWKFEIFLKELERKSATLTDSEKDVKKEIERAKLERKETTNVVQNWLERVVKVQEKINDIEKECKENRMCFKNCMPNYCSRRNVSKRSLELIGELEELINKCPSLDCVAVESLPTIARTLPPTRLLFGDEVIESYKKKIWEWLENENIGKIGVHGMGGVGKTTIMKQINNRLKDEQPFCSIIWVTVSEDLSLERLQSAVANAIQLDLSNDCDVMNRSGRLYEALLKKKKFVLILDDLWKSFSLEDIGIPEPNKENGAKIVLTTRSLHVCDDMKTQENIKVDVLPKGYAWDLFRSEVEKDVLTEPEIEKVAKLVAKECKGLPLALRTVGRALRSASDVCEWKNALNELRGSTHDIRGMEDDVFKRLKFSYTRLRNESLRACFLYCSLYPEDHEIDVKDLIKLWMWEGLLNEGGHTEVVMNKGYSILKELIDACVLEKASVSDVMSVKMHDLIRDMAIGITRDSPRFMVKTSMGLEEEPKEEEFVEDIERISLSRNNIASLTGQPNCPKLRTLFLERNDELSYISSSFLHDMHWLRVLNLSSTAVEALPDSLSDLVNLRALLLAGCQRLVVLPSLAKLKELRILNLSKTCIEELPPGMEGLVKLRYLDLSNTNDLKTIRVGILLQLSALEELSLRGSSWKFDSTNREAETIIDEISGLKRLDKLSINFEDMQSFLIYRESYPWQSLNKFVSLIYTKKREEEALCNDGEFHMHIDDSNCCSVLHFDDPHLAIKQCWCDLLIPQVLIDSRAFKRCEITGCRCTDYIFKVGEDSSLSTFEILRVCSMHNLKAISKGVMPCGALANLKYLILSDCDALEHVFTASIIAEVAALRKGEHHGILQSLRILHIGSCRRLKALFSSDLLQSLQNMEEIGIYECFKMEQMFVEGAYDEDICEVRDITRNAISLPRLRVLKLKFLIGLKCICKRTLICNSLQKIEVRGCPHLSCLPFSIENRAATVDGFIRGSTDWWNALEWEDPNTKTILQPLYTEETQLEQRLQTSMLISMAAQDFLTGGH